MNILDQWFQICGALLGSSRLHYSVCMLLEKWSNDIKMLETTVLDNKKGNVILCQAGPQIMIYQ